MLVVHKLRHPPPPRPPPDIRAGARIRSTVHFLMLKTAECEAIFKQYSRPDEQATADAAEPVLTYEGFMAALVHTAYKIRRPDIHYLSEAIRE